MSRPPDNIQTLKGIACLFVVAYHVIGDPGAGLDLPLHSLLPSLSESISMLRMPLFTFLSGVVYALRPVQPGGYGLFLRKKALRLYVPCVTVALLYFALAQQVPGNHAAGASGVLHLLVFPFAHFWFLQALLIILAVVGLVELGGLMATPRRYLCVLLATMLIQHLGNSNQQFFSFGYATYLLPYFVLGLGVQRHGAALLRNGTFVAAVLAVFIVTQSLHVAGVLGLYGAPLGQRSPTALLLSCSGLLVLWRFVPTARSLSAIGGYSFAIYLFHVFFTAGTRIALLRAGVHSVPLLFAAGLAAGVAGPILVEHVLRRMPRLFPQMLLGVSPRRAAADGAGHVA